MTDQQQYIENYVSAWKERDDNLRRALVEKTWTDGGRYVDPGGESVGHAAIDQNLAQVQAQLPGHEIRRTSAIDLHHDVARFEWNIVGPNGPVLAGVNVVEFAEDGRLRSVVGFFGPTPQDDDDGGDANG